MQPDGRCTACAPRSLACATKAKTSSETKTRPGSRATASPPRREMASLETEIAGLHELTRHDLQIAWRRFHGCEPPVRLGRDLLVRAIAYRMQERAQGGLAPATRRRLRALAREVEASGTDAFDPGPVLKPGTRLVREWGGGTHTLIVVEGGVGHRGRRYSLANKVAAR